MNCLYHTCAADAFAHINGITTEVSFVLRTPVDRMALLQHTEYTMRSTCFVAAAAVLSCANAFCFSPRMSVSGDVLAPFQAGKALKVPYRTLSTTFAL